MSWHVHRRPAAPRRPGRPPADPSRSAPRHGQGRGRARGGGVPRRVRRPGCRALADRCRGDAVGPAAARARAVDRAVAALHRPGHEGRRQSHDRRVRAGDGDRRHVSREHQRQRRVLRQARAADERGPGSGIRPDHALGLGRRQDGSPGLARPDRSHGPPHRDGEHRAGVRRPRVRPRQRAQHPVAGRHHGHRLRPRQDRARAHVVRRPLGSRVRGARRHADGDGRHDEPDAAVARAWTSRTRPTTTCSARRRSSSSSATPGSFASTTGRTTRARCPTATCGRRWRGRATSCSSSSRTRTCGSWCPRRAASCG